MAIGHGRVPAIVSTKKVTTEIPTGPRRRARTDRRRATASDRRMETTTETTTKVGLASLATAEIERPETKEKTA
jgi:hypothetical protein